MEKRKVLIIDDNYRKIGKTKNQILRVLPSAEITVVMTAKQGVKKLMTNEYDVAVIDMQMPIHGGNIDLQGGIYVLNKIKHCGSSGNGRIDTRNLRYCINSSSTDSYKIMKEHGYGDIMFILNDGIHSVKNQMDKLLL